MRGTLVAIGILLVAAANAESQGRPRDPATGAALSRFQERKAESLLKNALPCLGCHQLNGEGGRIGPDLSTVRQRRSAEYIAVMIADPQRTVPGTSMPRVSMPEVTRELISRYLASRPTPAPTAASSPIAAPSVASGHRDAPSLYATYCAACHGATGRGDGPNAAYLPVKPAQHASREAMSRRPDDELFDAIAGGGAVMGKSPRMPPFGATLSRGEITSLVRHIRELCKCRGPSWSEDGAGTRTSGGR